MSRTLDIQVPTQQQQGNFDPRIIHTQRMNKQKLVLLGVQSKGQSRSSHPDTPTIYDRQILSPRQIGTSESLVNKMIDEGVMTSEVSHSAHGGMRRNNEFAFKQLQQTMQIQLNVSINQPNHFIKRNLQFIKDVKRNMQVIEENESQNVSANLPLYATVRRERFVDKLLSKNAKLVKLEEVQGLIHQQEILENRRAYFKSLDNRQPVYQLAKERSDAQERIHSLKQNYTKESPFPHNKKVKSNIDQLFQLTEKAQEFLPYFTASLLEKRNALGQPQQQLVDKPMDANFKQYLQQMREFVKHDEKQMAQNEQYFPQILTRKEDLPQSVNNIVISTQNGLHRVSQIKDDETIKVQDNSQMKESQTTERSRSIRQSTIVSSQPKLVQDRSSSQITLNLKQEPKVCNGHQNQNHNKNDPFCSQTINPHLRKNFIFDRNNKISQKHLESGQLSQLLSPLSTTQLNRTAIKRICKICENERLNKKAVQGMEFAWKGRRHGEEELFPCNEMQIECQHRGKNQNPNGSPQVKEKPANYFVQMNSAMSAKGHFSTTRYDDSKGVEQWFGRAYWIGDELKPPQYDEQRKARTQLNYLVDTVINKKEKVLFREMLSKGLYKYKPEDFKSMQEKQIEKQTNFNPWSTQNFEKEIDKAYLKDVFRSTM